MEETTTIGVAKRTKLERQRTHERTNTFFRFVLEGIFKIKKKSRI